MLRICPISHAVLPSPVQHSTSRSRCVSATPDSGASFGTRKRLISECDMFASQFACNVRWLISADVRRSVCRAIVRRPNTPREAQLDCATPTASP
ncbi:hypothetical protein X947_5745 [Burkholderia pseudomallei MSHR7334]|nr:hypothetical protein X947_5745 [Burkholderia pseudomallei MSHR7334]